VPRLDIVALSDGEIVGHVISTIAKVSDCKGIDHEVLCVGPISVITGLQGKGIGSQLMRHSIGVATIETNLEILKSSFRQKRKVNRK